MKTLPPFALTKYLVSNRCKHLNHLDRIIALALASYRGAKTLRCNPSQEKLGKLTGYSRLTINKSTQRLADSGIIIPVMNGSSRSLHYFFTFDLTELHAVANERNLEYDEMEKAMNHLAEYLRRLQQPFFEDGPVN